MGGVVKGFQIDCNQAGQLGDLTGRGDQSSGNDTHSRVGTRTMLATYYTLSKGSAPTPEEMRQKSREYMLMKPKKYSYSDDTNTQGGNQPQRSSWYKPRDDMDKRRSCANCGSADHHVADCTTYKQGMKSLGYAPDEEEMSQMEEHELYFGLIIKIGARCFFCNQEGHFRMDCPLFWEAVKNQSHPKHKLALSAVQNQRNRQGEFETKNLERPSAELPTKTVKAVTQYNSAVEATAKNDLAIDYEKAAAEAINKVKQDLAAKKNRTTVEARDPKTENERSIKLRTNNTRSC